MSDECEVCCGMGRYPIIDSSGRERYTITCPECDGLGFEETDTERSDRVWNLSQKDKYEAIMAEKRAREQQRQP